MIENIHATANMLRPNLHAPWQAANSSPTVIFCLSNDWERTCYQPRHVNFALSQLFHV